MERRAFICGLGGPELSSNEREFLRETNPAGIIIFARNVQTPDQLRRLIADARHAANGAGGFLVLIDQEGGRVQRLRPPHWMRYPSAQALSADYHRNKDAARERIEFCSRLIAHDLHALGINTSCAPVLDVPVAGADNVIGDRAYGSDAQTVADLGAAAARGLLAGGVLPVMKHIPGHGRAMADSHFSLPAVDSALRDLQAVDFAAFRALKHLPMAMTAHVVFTEIDTEPVTTSKTAIDRIIRGDIGFDGLLMSDDISMRALSGPIEDRTEAALNAGCDLILHCNGNMKEMTAVASKSPLLQGLALRRFEAALAQLRPPQGFEPGEAEAMRKELVAMLA